MEQNQALKILLSGQNVFLTGKAGTGKTYLLNRFIYLSRKLGKNVAITASTGIAATHIGGQTIHSWTGIGIKDHISNNLAGYKQAKYDKVRQADILILDEISMLSANVLGMVDQVAKLARASDLPFGGLQVVLAGDFFQLPPVQKKDQPTQEMAYKSDSFKKSNFVVCYLEQVFRQNDQELIEIINSIREGRFEGHHFQTLEEQQGKTGFEEATKLVSRNDLAESINLAKLSELKTESRSYEMQKFGDYKLREDLAKNCLASESSEFKIGARVMFLKNSPIKGYSNGSIGEIVSFTREEKFPNVQLLDGRIVKVEPESWQVTDEEEVIAEIVQIPLRLAWAITIHKSQGVTLEQVEMDLGNLFSSGMGYVALSRAKNLSGLKITGLGPNIAKLSSEVFELDQFLQKINRQNIARYQNIELSPELELLINSESAEPLVLPKKSFDQTKQSKTKPKKPSTEEISKEYFDSGIDPKQIAEKRELKLETIVSHLAKFYPEKFLDDKKRIILEQVFHNWDQESLKSFKQILPSDVTFTEIKIYLTKVLPENQEYKFPKHFLL